MSLIKGKKFVTMLCVSALVGSVTMSTVVSATEVTNTADESTEVVEKEVKVEETATVEEPVVEPAIPAVEPPALKTEEEVVKEEIPVPSVKPAIKPAVKPAVKPAAPAENTEATTDKAKATTVTLTFVVQYPDGTTAEGTLSGKPGEAFGILLDKPTGGLALTLVESIGTDDNCQVNVDPTTGQLFFSGTYPSADKTYTAVVDIIQVAADIKVIYADESGKPIPGAPNTLVGGAVGETVQINSVTIPNYELVSEPSASMTISTEAQTHTFKYRPVANAVTVPAIIVDKETGEEIPGATTEHTVTGVPGQMVDPFAPAIGGYYVYAGPATIEMPAAGETVVLEYTLASVRIEGIPVDENGEEIPGAGFITLTGKPGETVTVTPPVIEGYTYVGPSTYTIPTNADEIPGGIALPYVKTPTQPVAVKSTVTFIAVDTEGNELGRTESATGMTGEQLKLTPEAWNFPGYKFARFEGPNMLGNIYTFGRADAVVKVVYEKALEPSIVPTTNKNDKIVTKEKDLGVDKKVEAKTLPKTGETNMNTFTNLMGMLMVAFAGLFVSRSKKENQ